MKYDDLKKPFPIQNVKWRVGVASKQDDWIQILCYVDARDIMDRLDEVVGPENWSDSYEPGPAGGVMCRLTIDGVTKCDVAENTDIEEVKGGVSDAFKRAAVKWGIGRYLYGAGTTWAEMSHKRSFQTPNKHYNRETRKTTYWGAPPSAYLALGYSEQDANALLGRTVLEAARRAGTDQIAADKTRSKTPLADLCGEVVGMKDPAAVGAWLGMAEGLQDIVLDFAKGKEALLKCGTRDEIAVVYKHFKDSHLRGRLDGEREAIAALWDKAAQFAAEDIKEKK